MKKISTILMAILVVVGLTGSALAFGPGWDGHGRYANYRGHDRGWHGEFQGHDRGRRDYGRHYDHNVPSHGSGAMISLPLVPLPGVSHLFPSINVNIH